MKRNSSAIGLVFGLAIIGLGACSQATSNGGAVTGDMCVDVPEGYFVYEDGKFTPVAAPETRIVERVVEVAPKANVQSRIGGMFAGMGFPWMNLDVRGAVATLSGEAPDAAAKEAAFNAGEAAIKNDPEASQAINVVVDAISVKGGDAGVGAAVADLGAKPTLAQCRRAFTQIMDGRNVEFETGNAVISNISARLLNATTGAALLCSDYTVEVRGHTDVTGDAGSNMSLSQARADAVRNYLIDRGVSGETLSAVGFGETRPLDPAMTAEAHAKNRRTEFIVKAR